MSNYEKLKELSEQTSVASINDVMNSGAHQPNILGIESLTPDRRLFGQAVTVRSLPARPDCIEHTKAEFAEKTPGGDPLMYAIKQCGPGKVLVIDSSGVLSAAVGGDTKFAAIETFGGAGVVTDGALRDQSEFRDMFNFASYCADITTISGTGSVLYPHDVNKDISCGGALVRPGDYIFGDEDGVIVIPEAMIEETLNNAIASEAQGLYIREKAVADGTTYGDVVATSDEWTADFLENSNLTDAQKAFFA